MAKKKVLTEKDILKMKNKQKRLVEYSFITNKNELLLDEDDEDGIEDPNNGKPEMDNQAPDTPEMDSPDIDMSSQEDIPLPQPEPQQSNVQPENGGSEVEVDVTELTDTQVELNDKITALTSKSDEVLNFLNSIMVKVDDNSAKVGQEIENIKKEIEKRNPTPVELIQKRSTLGVPFTETPEDYWNKKESEGDYKLTDDDTAQEYQIKASDLNDNNMNVYKSFGIKENEINQNLKDVLGD